MATITYTLDNKVNFPIPEINEPDEDAPDRLPSVYGNFLYSYDLSFFIAVEEGSATITSVDFVSLPNFVSGTKISNNTIRITRNTDNNPFTDEFYRFVRLLPDGITMLKQTLQPGTQKKEDTLFQWKPPTEKLLEDIPHTFKIYYVKSMTPGIVNSETFTVLQDIHWNLESSLQTFNNLLKRSDV